MTNHDIEAYRAAKDEFLKRDPRSPILDQERFDGLAYFDPDQSYSFTALPEVADGQPLSVQTSDGQQRNYFRAAKLHLDGPSGRIGVTLFSTEGQSGYFLPFRDSTSGKESYGAGRYLDLEANPDGTVNVDFNMAYNPYCAYSDAYSCPLPPSENWLSIPIEAGEKSFTGG